MSRFVIFAVSVVATAAIAAQTTPRREFSGGSAIASPSVLLSHSSGRTNGGPFTVDILILWRGSPGWSMRRTESGLGSGMSGGSPARDGTVSFTLDQGGLHLTASYDPSARTAVIAGEKVELKGANVIFVDRVDAADGPVIAGTTSVPPMNDAPVGIYSVLRTPEVLDYLRCEQQISASLNHPTMRAVCAEAILKGTIKALAVVTAIPTGPVTNRVAQTSPAAGPPPRPDGPSEGSGNGVVSPAVVGGWFTRRDGGGAHWLDLLVLWRGSPGWFLRSTTSGGSGGGGAGSRRGMTVRRGDLSLYAAFEPGPRLFQIEDTTRPLGNDNVVLVDDVDSPTGPRIVKTLRIEPALGAAQRVDVAIARSPEVVAYLRCDVKLPDARQQATMDTICARYTGK